MQFVKNTLFISLILLNIVSCTKRNDDNLPKIAFHTQRLELKLLDAAQLLKSNPNQDPFPVYKQHFQQDAKFIANWVFGAPQSFLDTIAPEVVDSEIVYQTPFLYFATSKQSKMLIDSVLLYYPPNYNFDSLLSLPFARLKQELPDFPTPTIRTLVFAYDPRLNSPQIAQEEFERNRLFLTQDKKMLGIGLDLFCSAKFPFLNPELPLYVKKGCTQEQLAPAILEHITKTIQRPLEEYELPSFAAKMVHHGIKYAVLDAAFDDDIPDSVIFNYSAEQMKWIEKNEAFVYKQFLPLLFEKNTQKFDKFLQFAPFTAGFDEQSPPRLGQYIGRQIVKAYMSKHPEVTLKQLLVTKDLEKVFKESGYKP